MKYHTKRGIGNFQTRMTGPPANYNMKDNVIGKRRCRLDWTSAFRDKPRRGNLGFARPVAYQKVRGIVSRRKVGRGEGTSYCLFKVVGGD